MGDVEPDAVVNEIVGCMPPLTAEGKQELAALLCPGAWLGAKGNVEDKQ